jgi:hypothetical protein
MNWIILQPGSAQTEIRTMLSVLCFEIAHVCCFSSIFAPDADMSFFCRHFGLDNRYFVVVKLNCFFLTGLARLGYNQRVV